MQDFKLQENIEIKEDVENRIVEAFTQRQQQFNMVKNKIDKRIHKNINKQNFDIEFN